LTIIYVKQNQQERREVRVMAQAVLCLPSKLEANPSTAKKEKKKKLEVWVKMNN
jgi:hypothetical protein